MLTSGHTEARKLRSRLHHPIVDADGHWGLLIDDDFRDFMFTSAVRFSGEVNPDFFTGTVVEKQAAEVLARPR
jgi:hypothetical protein